MRRRPADDGSIDWIGRLYDRFAGGLYRYALMILADPDGAADAVQHVFVAVLSGTGADMEYEERYLRRAVRNECFSLLRQRKRSKFTAVDPPLLEAVAANVDRPDERLALEQALRALPPEQREVVHLKIFEGWTFQEIANLSGDSINTVASRYRYAIEKMRDALGPRALM
jgi:RNA polymerase sigma-70 factor (ECF subfamily)